MLAQRSNGRFTAGLVPNGQPVPSAGPRCGVGECAHDGMEPTIQGSTLGLKQGGDKERMSGQLHGADLTLVIAGSGRKSMSPIN